MRFLVPLLLCCSILELYSWPRSRKKETGEIFGTPAAAEIHREEPAVVEAVFPPETPPVIIIGELPRSPRLIRGRGELEAELLVSFLLNENKFAGREFIEQLVDFYIREAAAEGINHDVAFAQMCLETGFLRFGGLVKAGMNNFCGLGSIGPGQPGEQFPSVQIGIRAHIQHLQAYATDLPLRGDLVDPRYRFVRRGSAPVIQALAGSWAADRQYAGKIEAILQRLYRYKELSLKGSAAGSS
ncbi:MAG: glucosaminidase domain-containing protein [Spirochaetaceae bacterium]|jgi:hypothetical protein|nr:glucosaminidase domain-containing protein [Spirochaetaceae bacterium]